MPKESPTDLLRRQDEHNYSEIRKVFKNESAIPDDLIRVYDLYGNAVQPHLSTRGRHIASAMIGGLCRKHLLLGSIALFRLHSGQMFRESRSAVEAAGIAHSIAHDDKMLSIFLEDDGRPEQRERARKAFIPRKIFSEAEPLLKVLRGHYDIASARSHTNIVNFVLHLAKGTDPSVTDLHIQDIQDDRVKSDLPLLLVWLCYVHVAILSCVDIIFPDVPNTPEMARFKAERKYVLEKLDRFNKLHKHHLESASMLSMPPS